MSKANKRSAVELKREELTFGVSDAVEVLVVKYLSNVKPKVEAAGNAVRDAVEANEAAVERVIESIDSAKYNHESKILGIKSRVRDVTVNLNKTAEDSDIRIVLALTDTDIVSSNYQPEIGKYRSLPMSSAIHKRLTTSREVVYATQKVAHDTDLLLDTTDVKRALRARVMSVKLKEAGFDVEELLNDEEVSAIINI